jgi:hypothetical protein
MLIDRLETHDRLEHFIQDQWSTISEGATDCLTKNPDSLALQEKSPYVYIFAHPRTHDNGVSKRLLWQPRLTKPTAQTNSYLFRAGSKSDVLMVCWLIPPREMWDQYKKGNVCESNIVLWSINQFQYNRDELERKDEHDLSDARCKEIWLDILSHSTKS